MRFRFVLLLLPFWGSVCLAQTKSSINPKVEFSVSSIDKSKFYDEIAYQINDNKLVIIHREPISKKDYKGDVLFSIELDSLEKINLYKMAFAISNDSLKSQYSNLCITDGMFLIFNFSWTDKKKSTVLINYYLDKMQPFVDFINKKSPDKYKIWYDKSELEREMQNCPQDRILN